MLTHDEKVDLYFDEALRCMNLSEVEKTVKDRVFIFVIYLWWW